MSSWLSTYTNDFESELIPQRPSGLLGKKFRFERASALNFSPDMFFRLFTGKPIKGCLEKWDHNVYLLLNAVVSSDEFEAGSGSRLQNRTREEFREMLAKARYPGDSPSTLEYLREIQGSRAAPWRVARVALANIFSDTGAKTSRIWKPLLTRLAYYDRLTTEFSRTKHNPERMARYRSLVKPSLEYWHSRGLGLRWEVIALLDSALQHLTWLDAVLRDGSDAASAVSRLTNPDEKPIRHWFDDLLAATHCRNLLDLEHQLARDERGRINNRRISHDLLKKWASSQRMIPSESALVLLKTLNLWPSHEAKNFWFVRLLTFLTELICCFAKDPTCSLVAQRYIHERLDALDDELQKSKGKDNRHLFVGCVG